ncbi:MAG: AAA family ATPase [Gammaproteobacteria bacterium]|nr:AAA family ATPase [Gammaproteobacteria bacterium]
MKHTALAPEQLYRHCDPATLGFATTDDIQPLDAIGQERASRAIEFGVGMPHKGFNLYVSGPSNAGKHTFVRQMLKQQQAVDNRAVYDWCYLHNFAKPSEPRLLKLPAGLGHSLKLDLEKCVLELLDSIPGAFEDEMYQEQISEIEQELISQRDGALSELRQEAQKDQIDLIRTPRGYDFVPLVNNKILDQATYDSLPETQRIHIAQRIDELGDALQTLMEQIPRWQREAREKVRGINESLTFNAIRYLFDEMRAKYQDYQTIVEQLNKIEEDIIENSEAFRDPEAPVVKTPAKLHEDAFLRRYLVNVIVEHERHAPVPLVYEVNPTHDNLIGKIEYQAETGSVYTDYSLIRSGALHQANGGYLVLDAHKVSNQPQAWEALKRCLASRQIRIDMEQAAHTMSLEPEPMPLDVKVVLLGDRMTYYVLSEYDPDFSNLFKVNADFEDDVERNQLNEKQLASLLASQCKHHKLKPLEVDGVARVIEHASRLVEDNERLSTHMGELSDLLAEANYWARQENAKVISRAHVQRAIDENVFRHARAKTRFQQSILRGDTVISTTGSKIAQVNGLTVITFGNSSFGNPSRITATARPGENKVIDIEHEAELGGDIHTKGVLIMSHYLGSRYARQRTLSLSASVVFEQSYGEVDGDSASMAELCALLSAITKLPIDQQLAITGSIDQHGNSQAIGGVNEKIEGFFDICQARGLTGQQGVIIPTANVSNLMLRMDVVDAVRQGKFHIHAIDHLDQAMELLFGLPAGTLDEQGNFTEGSINFRVERALLEMAELIHGQHDHDESEKT